jgi:hypothetical protein
MRRAFFISRNAMPTRLAVFEKKVDVVSQGTPRSLAVGIKARYERSEKAAEYPSDRKAGSTRKAQ